ncbi:MAG: hypothetical protein IT359_19715 [Gemmatimonadaceae bacterium]|nr:hypothetical protein [Gemmatimonadaceae bacterium]
MRADTETSVVASIELGESSPSWDMLERLLAVAGVELEARLVPCVVIDSRVLDDVARIRRLSPEDRLAEVANVSRFLAAARRST